MTIFDPYQRISYRGVILNRRTAAGMDLAQERFGRSFGSIPQGSYHAGTSQSAGTHDGGGAVDIFDSDLDGVQHVMRAVGFAAWHRTFLPGEWDAHCHAIMLADKEMSTGARAQIPDYRDYKDGLASHAHDGTWHPFPQFAKPIPVFNYLEYIKVKAWNGGDVYVSKLHAGQKDSDSVRRIQYRLKHFTHAKSPALVITGDYGSATIDAVRHWQHVVGEAGPNDGRSITDFQAKRILGPDYTVHS